ncbi:MAG: hypothetical protein ACI8WB_002024 [Phenylobacterium sp.]|jgi:hypothetical protein
MNLKRYTAVLLLFLLLLSGALLTASQAVAADSWLKIIVVAPKVTLLGPLNANEQQRLNQINQTSFSKAVAHLKSQLALYYPTEPLIEPYQGNDFYQRQDEQGDFFLRQLAPSKSKDLILSGQFESDPQSGLINLKIDGYDGQKKTSWSVYMSPFSPGSLTYLEEIYSQLFFEVLNEAATDGLKPRNAKMERP